jgi:hypothetical protein
MHEMFALNLMRKRRPPFFWNIAFFEKLAIADPIAKPGATRNTRTCSDFFRNVFGIFLVFFRNLYGFFLDFFGGGGRPGRSKRMALSGRILNTTNLVTA